MSAGARARSETEVERIRSGVHVAFKGNEMTCDSEVEENTY